MEFLTANRVNTTSALVVPSGNTGTQAYLFDRNRELGFSSVGYESNSSLVVTVSFSSSEVLSHVLLQNHNLKQFRVFYDGVTANSWANVTTNSQTSTYIEFSSTTVSSVTIQMDVAMTTNTEKFIGELYMGERVLSFVVNPPAQGYQPTQKKKRIRHEMPDGGVKLLQISQKFNTSIRLEYITETFKAGLKSVYDAGLPNYFVPFPTTSAWGAQSMGEAYEVLWTSDWDFTFRTNDKQQGYGGAIVLEETPSA